MFKKIGSKALFLALVLTSSASMAADYNQQKLNDLVAKLKVTGEDPALIAAVNQQNGQRLTMGTITSRDQKWQATSGMDSFMRELMSNAGAKRLSQIEKENRVIVESFLMDNKGANVAMTNKTSDYWQGDEAKFKKSFAGGKGSVHIGKSKFDKSAQAYVVQVSVPVMSGGQAIGAITYGVNIDELN